jgi:phage gp29-like protein
LPFEPLARFCNQEISKAILGNTLSTEVSSSGGNRALGEVHERTEEDIATDDAAALAETIRRDLVAPIVQFNMPEGTPIPRIAFISEEQVDLLKVAQRDQILINSGLPLSKAELYEIHGRRPPEDDDDAVTVQASPQAPDAELDSE